MCGGCCGWIVMAFELEKFVLALSLCIFDQCCKEELLQLAGFYNVSVPRSARKCVIREVVYQALVDEGVLHTVPELVEPGDAFGGDELVEVLTTSPPAPSINPSGSLQLVGHAAPVASTPARILDPPRLDRVDKLIRME